MDCGFIRDEIHFSLNDTTLFCTHVIRHALRLVKRDAIMRTISTQPLRQMLPVNQVSNPELLLHSTSTVNGSIEHEQSRLKGSP